MLHNFPFTHDILPNADGSLFYHFCLPTSKLPLNGHPINISLPIEVFKGNFATSQMGEGVNRVIVQNNAQWPAPQ